MNELPSRSRRQFLSGAFSTAAAVLAGDAVRAPAQYSHVSASAETFGQILIINSGYRFVLDSKSGSLASFRSTFGIDRELLIPNHVQLPLVQLELMDDHRSFTTVTSLQAEKVKVEQSADEKEQIVSIAFRAMGGLPLDVLATIRCPRDETLTYWTLELDNRTDLWIAHVQFPVIRVPFDDAVNGLNSYILSSFADGVLAGPVEPSMAADSWGGRDRNTPEIWRYNNYPGQWASTQLMAYYNDAGGLYVACDDNTGLPKFIDPLMEDDGVTLGLGHYPGTRGPSKTKLGYNVVLGTFHGDWYAAAEIYREWASKQPFCAVKLAERSDCPQWIAESPIGIAFPMRGQSDWDGPAKVNPEYTPATNALPYLEKLASRLESPLMPIVFNWEHGGPWVQPDAFPALGGNASMTEFMEKAKAKGWHPIIYGDGLCWVTWQKNTDYDGMPYFNAHDGKAAVAQKWDGTLLQDVWAWRKNYVACVGTPGGCQMVQGMTRGMAEFGPAVIQQFDQGPGPRACYSSDHAHPPVPGPWMTAAFNGLLSSDAKAARAVTSAVAMSCEGAPPETYLQHFQIWDARTRNCPLYAFLYHEYANGHDGFYTNRINDAALRLSVARALVTGYMMNFTLRNGGLIEYDWDQPWTSAIPDQDALTDWIKRSNHLRSGIAKPYLIFGKMLRPWKVKGVTELDFGWGKEPLVQSARWQAPDGRIGVILANSGDLGESPQVELEGIGKKKLLLYLDGHQTEQEVELPQLITLDMLPRSLAMIEVL